MAKNARRRSVCLALLLGLPLATVADEPRTNVYGDPFVQATSGIAHCPVPEGPMLTAAEARAESHGRVERGTSCYRSGRCRLPNAYLYDRELAPRVAQFIVRAGRFADTSVWVTSQRRWIRLQGCVQSTAQSAALIDAVRGIDDVEAVVDELVVGSEAPPRYRVRTP